MKILLIMGLGSSSANTFIEPLASSNKANSVFVVRDTPGITLPNVTYCCPPRWTIRFPITKTLIKFAIALHTVSTQKCDIILANYLYPHGLIGFMISKLFRKPICISLISGMNSTRHWGDCAEALLIRVLNRTTLVTVTGSATRDIYQRKGLKLMKIFCLPNVVDARRFYPMDTAKEYDVVYIGRLSPEKQIDILLQAIATVKQTYPRIRVGIAGHGPAKKAMEKLSVRLGISDSVEFVGFVDDSNSFLNKGKIFVLPSKGEGFPIALLEAMSAGLACIISNVGDISDVAIDGQNCLIIDKQRDIQSYANAIIRILNDKMLYDILSSNAVKVRKSHSLENSKLKWSELLETMAKRAM